MGLGNTAVTDHCERKERIPALVVVVVYSRNKIRSLVSLIQRANPSLIRVEALHFFLPTGHRSTTPIPPSPTAATHQGTGSRHATRRPRPRRPAGGEAQEPPASHATPGFWGVGGVNDKKDPLNCKNSRHRRAGAPGARSRRWPEHPDP